MDNIRITDLTFHILPQQTISGFEYPGSSQGISSFIMSSAPSRMSTTTPQRTSDISPQGFPSAYIGAPCIIGANTEVRHCAFIRGSALVGENCVVGNSAELKNVIIFDNVQTPHYNYVGDSILGYKSHMGAGSITSNVKSDKTNVVIKSGEERIETGIKKIGAMLGDFVEVGCNSVLNPGTIVGRNSNIYPTSCVRGVVPADSIWKTGGAIVKKN